MMTEGAPDTVRRAEPGEADACGDILNAWIDDRDWMPRIHRYEAVRAFYRDVVFHIREVWAVGRPVQGFLAMDSASSMVMALYVASPGQGIGKALLDHAKAGRDWLELWTFVANSGARRFYAREGFREVRQTDGTNEEGLPDVLLRWERAA